MTGKSTFKKGAWGYAYKGEKYYEFTDKRITVIRGGTDPACWVKTEKTPGWHASRMQGDAALKSLYSPEVAPPDHIVDRIGDHYVQQNGQMLLSELPGNMKFMCGLEYASCKLSLSIPPEVLDRIAWLPERRWHVYQMLVRCRGALELFDSNPALCFALANNWVFRSKPVQQPMRSARSLVNQKRAKILKTLGFPVSKSVERILRKIPPAALTVERLLYLRNTLKDPLARKRLAHLPVLSWGVLRLVCDPSYEPFVTRSFLIELTKSADDRYTVDSVILPILRDYIGMHRLLHQRDPYPVLSDQELQRKHNLVTDHLRCAEMEQRNLEFPAVPVPGGEAIQPILSWAELLQESEEQHNCVFSFRNRILQGAYAVYRVFDPVRATAGLRRTANGWCVDQILATCNQRIRQQDYQVIAGELKGMLRHA